MNEELEIVDDWHIICGIAATVILNSEFLISNLP